MANQWLRLWHDLPNDPKWRTIARVSKQSIGNVMAVYIHLLVNASNASERGKTQNVCSEDIASALDVDTEQVDAILSAMQGRVMDGDCISGWSKRQPEREDGAAERAKAWREAKKAEKAASENTDRTQANASEREQTLDKDKSREEEKPLVAAATEEAPGGEPEKEGKRSKPSPSEKDHEVARWLFDAQRKANPSARTPNWFAWANNVRLMREVDGRTHRQICELFQWAKADNFWSPNIQCPAKLREKWDTLTERRARDEPAAKPRTDMKDVI